LPKIEYYSVKKFNSIKQMMEMAVEDVADKIAFKYIDKNESKEVTYKEFNEDTKYLGTALVNLKMHNSHVAVIGNNSYDWLTVYLTMLKTNGVVVPVDKELTKEDIINVLNNSDSEVLFYAEKFEQYIDEFKQKVPKIKYYIGFEREKDQDNVLSYIKFKNSGKESYEKGNKEYDSIVPDTSKLRLLVYTSGTTGLAKGVMLSEKNLIADVYHGLEVSTVYGTCLSVLPYHHTYEAVAGILVALHHHATICINDNLKNVLKNIQLYKPEYIYLVPAFAEVFYKKVWSNAKSTGKDKILKIMIVVSNILRKIGIDLRKKLFKSIHEAFGDRLIKIVVGGAPVRKEIGKFFNSIGIDLINGYGITECSPLVSVNQDKFNDPSTVGLPLRCVQLKLDNITPEGEGEICVKGDNVMMGYYKNPEKTAEVLKDGWFNTGDYGKINSKGQLLITGRKKNLIVLENGKNVFPEEIEEYIMGIPYVQEVIVKGIKNDIGSETGLCAEVFLSEEKIQELDIKDPQTKIRKDITEATAKLPIYKRINEVQVRDKEFNKTTTNKIKR